MGTGQSACLPFLWQNLPMSSRSQTPLKNPPPLISHQHQQSSLPHSLPTSLGNLSSFFLNDPFLELERSPRMSQLQHPLVGGISNLTCLSWFRLLQLASEETSAGWLEHTKGMNWFTSQFKSQSGVGFRIMTLPPIRTRGRDSQVHSGKHPIKGCRYPSLVGAGGSVWKR